MATTLIWQVDGGLTALPLDQQLMVPEAELKKLFSPETTEKLLEEFAAAKVEDVDAAEAQAEFRSPLAV